MATTAVTVPPAGREAPARHPVREVPALATRVLIIGLDGATWDVLLPLIDEGHMPCLARMIREGAWGVLRSTKPPITPAAWTTFMTGKGPGRHGIVDFEKYDPASHSLSFNSTFEIREKTIWELLSTKGFRVGSINLPMTYPPQRVNGFMVSGFETPSVNSDFTWPPELKHDILRRWPDYCFGTNWQRSALGGDDVFALNLEYIARSFEIGGELTRYCGDRFGWDVLMVLFKLVDNLQHKAWRYLDPTTRGANPRRAALAAACLDRLDRVLGDLMQYARSTQATVLVMSDHGHGRLDGKVQPNLLLKRWGYLALHEPLIRARTRARYILDRLRRRKTSRFANHRGIDSELAIDWSRTRACVMHAGIYGFLYINLRGRQPCGIVPPEEYDSLRDEIRHRLLTVTCRDRDGRDIPVFTEVHKPEELYRCSRRDNPWMPDLLLVPQPGLAVVRKIRGLHPVRWTPLHRAEGTHREEGILAAWGPHVAPGRRVDAEIADITPTLLAMMGLRVPADMEGRAITDLFETPPTIEFEPPVAREVLAPTEEVYTEEEKAKLTERLSDLGYLE